MRPAFYTALSLALLCAALSASADTVQKKAPASHAAVKRTSSRSHTKAKPRSKSKISHAPMDTERATQIQTALIKSGYMTGQASGNWDTQSQAAMQKLQSDNGWQTKIVPDSRALIKLGLGPQPTATTPPLTN